MYFTKYGLKIIDAYYMCNFFNIFCLKLNRIFMRNLHLEESSWLVAEMVRNHRCVMMHQQAGQTCCVSGVLSPHQARAIPGPEADLQTKSSVGQSGIYDRKQTFPPFFCWLM